MMQIDNANTFGPMAGNPDSQVMSPTPTLALVGQQATIPASGLMQVDNKNTLAASSASAWTAPRVGEPAMADPSVNQQLRYEYQMLELQAREIELGTMAYVDDVQRQYSEVAQDHKLRFQTFENQLSETMQDVTQAEVAQSEAQARGEVLQKMNQSQGVLRDEQFARASMNESLKRLEKEEAVAFQKQESDIYLETENAVQKQEDRSFTKLKR